MEDVLSSLQTSKGSMSALDERLGDTIRIGISGRLDTDYLLIEISHGSSSRSISSISGWRKYFVSVLHRLTR